MPSKEVDTFWLVTSAPMSLPSRIGAVALVDVRTLGQAGSDTFDGHHVENPILAPFQS